MFKNKTINGWAENRKREIERMIHNDKVEVHWYEEGHNGINGITKKMSDIWAREKYELSKIRLEAFDKYGDDAYDRIRKVKNSIPISFNVEADIRVRATTVASKGRTTKVTELTNDELIEARMLANSLVDNYIEKYRAAVL